MLAGVLFPSSRSVVQISASQNSFAVYWRNRHVSLDRLFGWTSESMDRFSLDDWWRVSLRVRGRRVHGTALATITSAFIALGLTVAEPRDFRAADTQTNDHPTARALVYMSELVSDRTQGRHRMIVYPGALLGEQEATFEQTRIGAIDINRTNMAPFASFVGEANIFGLPYLFRSTDHRHRVLDGPIGDDILQSLEPHGFVGLAFFESGARSVYTA
jgi:TRAP-type C4-dicarboxylate transport system substrate-binding protein